MMTDLTEELNIIKGVEDTLWILSGFGDSDLKSLSDMIYNQCRLLRRASEEIARKTEND